MIQRERQRKNLQNLYKNEIKLNKKQETHKDTSKERRIFTR